MNSKASVADAKLYKGVMLLTILTIWAPPSSFTNLHYTEEDGFPSAEGLVSIEEDPPGISGGGSTTSPLSTTIILAESKSSSSSSSASSSSSSISFLANLTASNSL